MSASNHAPNTIFINGHEILLRVKVNRRAKRLILRVDALTPAIDLTCPSRRAIGGGLAFAQQRQHWIAERLAEGPPRQPFIIGAKIPIQGIEHEICQSVERRRAVLWQAEDQKLWVGGEPAYVSRRVEDWLKKQARKEFCQLADLYSEILGVTRRRICVRDTKTRWGSCSSNGSISFSWRLIMAPLPVYRYVVAHEVSHLVHMDHSFSFWKTVDQLISDRQQAQQWLKKHGKILYGFGGTSTPSSSFKTA